MRFHECLSDSTTSKMPCCRVLYQFDAQIIQLLDVAKSLGLGHGLEIIQKLRTHTRHQSASLALQNHQFGSCMCISALAGV
jgi:hypothetical protein